MPPPAATRPRGTGPRPAIPRSAGSNADARLIEEPSPAHRITAQQTTAIGLQLIDALDAVHTVGTLHRDIKPANVLLRRDGSAVLTDFGIAALDDGEFLTAREAVKLLSMDGTWLL
jgi:serine/threonine protein kinase